MRVEGERLKYWLALSMVRGVERFNVQSLIERFGGPDEIFSRGQRELEAFSSAFAGAVKEFSGWKRVDKELSLIEKYGARVVTYADPEYPALLKLTYDPPYLLYMKGAPYRDTLPSVGIVGTRQPTPYGLQMAEALARDLSLMGVAVISGMARGCDSAAHRGALSAGGFTAAVLGTGVDKTYPRENEKLYNGILEKGVLISEYPMTTPPLQHNFPRRNRIISGLSKAVLVIEAPLRSGSLMTARLALEYGRDVCAVPGQATSHRSSGANKLIKDGAALIECADDVAALLQLAPRPDTSEAAEEGPPLEGDEMLVWSALSDSPAQIDSIVESTGFSAAKASTLLLTLELKGLIQQRPGKSFLRRI